MSEVMEQIKELKETIAYLEETIQVMPECLEAERLDRPELKRKIDLEALAGTHRVIPCFKDYCDGEPIDAYLTSASITKILNKILALIPDRFDIEKEQAIEFNKIITPLRHKLAELDKKLDDREEDLIEAKKQERERIRVWGREPCEHQPMIMRRECAQCWQALKETDTNKEV